MSRREVLVVSHELGELPKKCLRKKCSLGVLTLQRVLCSFRDILPQLNELLQLAVLEPEHREYCADYAVHACGTVVSEDDNLCTLAVCRYIELFP